MPALNGKRNGRVASTIAGAFEELRADYRAAKESRHRPRLTGVQPLGGGADYHYRTELAYFKTIEQFRAYDRDDGIVGQGITRLIDNCLQQGIKLDPGTGDEEVDADLRQRWENWTVEPDLCHSAGELTFHKIAKLVARHVIVDGDVIILPTDDGTVQPIEGHRLRTPRNTKLNVVHGILLDDKRRHMEYWLTKEDVGLLSTVQRVSDMRKIRARDAEGNKQVFHIANPKRFSQTRGVSALAAIANFIGMHDDLQFANLVKAQVASCFAVLEEREVESGFGEDAQTGAQETETLSDGASRLVEGISPGMTWRGDPGVKLTGFSPNIPNPEFFPHAMLILTIIAVNLNLPLAVLLLDPSKTNFSGWRGAIDQARMGFREFQGWMIAKFYRPIYRWKLRRWIADDPKLRTTASRLDATDDDIFRHRWSPPTWPYIEPVKDAQGDAIIMKNRLNSRRGVLAVRGFDIDQIDREIVADNQRLIAAGIAAADALNAASPESRVDWRELVGFDPKGRAPPGRQRAMEDIARAVRSGVGVTVSEARVALGLPPVAPKGESVLRFNDQDILQYHIENAIVKVNEARERLRLPKVDGGDVFVQRVGTRRVSVDGSPEGGGKDDESEESEEEGD